MNRYAERIIAVENHFHQNDLNLGYRRLIDLILDLGEISFYKKVIAYADSFYNESLADVEKKAQALAIIKDIKQAPTPTFKEEEILLSTYQVEKVYHRKKFKLHPITFQLKSREVIGLVGENGNGKTTLLQLIGGDLKPTAGKIIYQFTAALPYSFDLKSKLVYVPQRIEELYGTLMDNLQFTLSCYSIRKEENLLLAQVMLARLGLWKYRNLEWRQLSSGYKMRFELARNLLRRPKVLLLDEPLANLDIMAQQIILEDLRFLAQSLTHPFGVILSSQQLYEVEKVSDEVIFLEQGMLKYQGDKEGLDGKYTIIEIDVDNTKEQLSTVLMPLNLKEIKFNGGSHIAYFEESTSMKDVLIHIGNSALEVKYIRDISNSSRRFFIN